MVAPLTKKNTIEKTGFRISDDGFFYNNLKYGFDDVVETRIIRSVFEVKTIGVGVTSSASSISIIFAMKDGGNVQLTEQPTMFSNSRLDEIDRIQNIFIRISDKTFNSRVAKYTKQLEVNEYFTYAGWRFYPQQRKIVNIEKSRSYSLESTKLLKSYGFITVVDMNESVAEKLSRKISGDIGINTISDTDVIFALLKGLFNIEWK